MMKMMGRKMTNLRKMNKRDDGIARPQDARRGSWTSGSLTQLNTLALVYPTHTLSFLMHLIRIQWIFLDGSTCCVREG